MIGKIIAGSSFAGTVGYVMKELSRILDAEGVNPPEVKNIIEDFKDQTRLNPRLKNTVGHISFSFSPKEAPHMTDALMTQIAKEYMQKMGITDTQYLLVRHLDQPHPHCHLVYNRVGNKGQTISDKNIKIRNTKVCRELTEKYGLHLAPGKDSVRRERLREPDKTKYEIYDAIKGCLPKCKSWNDLEGRLKEQGINVRYKYCGNTDRKQGVLFSKNDFEFSGSKIDRQFSFSDLFGTGGGKTNTDRPTVNFGGNIGELPLPPNSSPVELSEAQLQRKPGESPEEYLARITALLNTVAEAMAIAAMERERRLRERMTKSKQKL